MLSDTIKRMAKEIVSREPGIRSYWKLVKEFEKL